MDSRRKWLEWWRDPELCHVRNDGMPQNVESEGLNKGPRWPDEYLKGCHFREGLALFCIVPVSGAGPVQRRCRGETSEQSGISKGRMWPQKITCQSTSSCLFFFRKDASIRWVDEQSDPYHSFPTKSLRYWERSSAKRESRDEQMPGVYCCFKWNESCLSNSTKSFISTGGYF